MPQRREASSRPTGGTSSAAASASLTPVAHRMQQAVLGRLSGLRASRHAGWMQASAVGPHEHACTSTAGVIAHCEAIHPSVPSPRTRPSLAAQQRPWLPVANACELGAHKAKQHTMGPEGHGQGGERERRRNTDERIAPSFTGHLPRVYPVHGLHDFAVPPLPSRRDFVLQRALLAGAT